MLRIRLQRLGRKNQPVYRIVLAEHSTRVKGRFIEAFGHYNPLAKPAVFQVDAQGIAEWIAKGAQPSNTVARLLKGSGVKGMEPYIVEMRSRETKNPKEVAQPAAAPAA